MRFRGLAAMLVLLVVPIGAATAVSAAPATGRQACDPAYGCPPGSVPPASITCTISVGSGRAGDPVTGTVSGAASGTEAFLALDGGVVAHGTVDSSLPDGRGQATLGFLVPSGLSPGPHSVVMYGAAFSCDPTFGAGFNVLQVLAADVTKGGGAATSGLGVPLPRTGAEILATVLVGLLLIAFGWLVVREARRRRRQAVRARNEVQLLGR